MSIYGNPITLGGGGLKSTDALLCVQAQTGSNVTISKGGVTKTQNGLLDSDNPTVYNYFFTIKPSQFDSVNPWTVTVSNPRYTDSTTIVIDSAEVYRVPLLNIPFSYVEVEYLQGSGNQYVRTAVKPSEVIGAKFKYYKVADVDYAAVFGASASGGMASNALAFADASRGYVGFRYYNGNVSFPTQPTNTELVVDIACSSGSQTVQINEDTYTGTITGSSLQDSYIDVFGNNYSGTHKSNESMNGRIYYFKLTGSNNTLLCDLVPCYRKSDSVAGMYDRVTNTFLTNQGSGSFVVGGDV